MKIIWREERNWCDRGNEEVGDKEEDSGSGDQKQNARKIKRAPEGEEGKQDNEGDKNGNGDQKWKAHKKGAQKVNETTGAQITDANNRTTCAQFSYYRDFHPSRRSDRRATRANTGLINTNVICYSNAIFQHIASCANLGNYADFLRSPPNEEHWHFELYYKFKSVISFILRSGMDGIDPSKFIDLYKKHYKDINADEGKWHDNCIKQWIYL